MYLEDINLVCVKSYWHFHKLDIIFSYNLPWDNLGEVKDMIFRV